MSFIPIFAKRSDCIWHAPRSVVHTGAKSCGCETNIDQGLDSSCSIQQPIMKSAGAAGRPTL